jgi:hypothetical protein
LGLKAERHLLAIEVDHLAGITLEASATWRAVLGHPLDAGATWRADGRLGADGR